MDVHIVILNYNGSHLLKRHLPSVINAAKNSSCGIKITVLDNGSSDDSVSYVKQDFPDLETVSAKENLVLVSYNEFLRKIPEKIVVLLNNDIGLEPGFIDYMIPYFEDESVFAVAPKVMDTEGKNITGGCMDFSLRAGLFRNEPKTADKNNYTLFIGSSAAYDREKFLELNGYDPIYLPGTYEDLDLCYRAWQRGWKCVYEDKAIAYHDSSASFDRIYTDKKRQTISARNAYLFIWKNIHDPAIILSNVFLYPLVLFFNILRLRFDLALGSVKALALLPDVLVKRREAAQSVILSEKNIRDLFQKDLRKAA